MVGTEKQPCRQDLIAVLVEGWVEIGETLRRLVKNTCDTVLLRVAEAFYRVVMGDVDYTVIHIRWFLVNKMIILPVIRIRPVSFLQH